MNFNLVYNSQGSGKSTQAQFEDPFILPSNSFVPQSLDTALDFALMLYYMNARYRRASIRTVAHFITDLDITTTGDGMRGADSSEKDAHYDFLTGQMDLMGALLVMGQEFACFGNSFWRMHFPFKRWLLDPRGDLQAYSVDIFPNAKYLYKEMLYEVPDPTAKGPMSARPKIKMPFEDRPDLTSLGAAEIGPVPLDPKRIFILYSHASRKCQYIYRFEDWFVQNIKEGVMHEVNQTPMEMLQAIAHDQDFLFDDDQIFHFKAPTISGLNSKGWGIPETLLNYRELHQLQVYRKMDEQVGLDFMMPFRIFTPALGGASVTDALVNQHLGTWGNKIEQMVHNRRADPFKMHAFPFPMEYTEVGASKDLVPKDLIEYQNDALLDAMGYPAELFRSSLQVQQVPTALRLFESSFGFIHTGFQRFVQWVSNRSRSYLGQPLLEVSLQRPSMADDLEARHIYLQLVAGGEISRAKGYRPFGVKDPMQELEERMEEDLRAEKIRRKKEQDYQREVEMESMSTHISAQQQAAAEQAAAQQGGAVGGGMPGPQMPAHNPNATPMDTMAEAEQLARQALQVEPDSERRRFLQQIAASNPELHMVVKGQMERIRSQGASQGREAAGKQPM